MMPSNVRSLLAVSAILASTALASTARADVASDRVVLILGGACPKGATTPAIGSLLRRLYLNPDGTTTQETTEYRVPPGHYLEVTDMEWQPSGMIPRWGQQLTLFVQNRNNASQFYAAAAFGWGPMSIAVQSGSNPSLLDPTPQSVYDRMTRTHSFGTGPLVSSAGRLCVQNSWDTNQLPSAGAGVIVRGRLIPTGGVVVSPGDTLPSRQ